MNPITMKLVVDDLILQALREDITFEDVSTASVRPTARPATVELIAKAGHYRRPGRIRPAPLSCWIRRAPCCSMSRMATRCMPAITWARCGDARVLWASAWRSTTCSA